MHNDLTLICMFLLSNLSFIVRHKRQRSVGIVEVENRSYRDSLVSKIWLQGQSWRERRLLFSNTACPVHTFSELNYNVRFLRAVTNILVNIIASVSGGSYTICQKMC